MSKAVLAHTVYFWLKEGVSHGDRLAFEAGLEKLGQIPLIQAFTWGPPADARKRDVVDDSYDYALNSSFASMEDEEAYQQDPDHQVFIDNHKHIWEKVQVYNNMIK